MTEGRESAQRSDQMQGVCTGQAPGISSCPHNGEREGREVELLQWGPGLKPPAADPLPLHCSLQVAGPLPAQGMPSSASIPLLKLSFSSSGLGLLSRPHLLSQGTNGDLHASPQPPSPSCLSSPRWCVPGAPTTGLSSNTMTTGPAESV